MGKNSGHCSWDYKAIQCYCKSSSLKNEIQRQLWKVRMKVHEKWHDNVRSQVKEVPYTLKLV